MFGVGFKKHRIYELEAENVAGDRVGSRDLRELK
jgi:hypothetical protein